MRSIQSRLNIGLGVSLAVTLLLIGLAGSYGMRVILEQWLETRLEHDAETLLISLEMDAEGMASLNPVFQNPIYLRPFSGHYYVVETQQQHLRSRSLWDKPLDLPGLEGESVRVLRMQGPMDQLMLVRIARYEKAGHSFVIAVAEDLSPLRTSVRTYQAYYLFVSALVLVLLLLLQRRMLCMGFTPLQHTFVELKDLGHGRIQQLGEDVPAEIQPLVREVNHLLTLLQQRVSRSRNSLGNLAHALKTPLAIMRQLAERSALQAHPELQQQLCTQVDQLHHRVESELRRARLSGGGYQGAAVHISDELPALVDVLRMAYQDKHLHFQVEIPEELVYFCDQEDLLEMVGNLLDNACKWAESEVLLRVQQGDYLSIAVEDDGPGCNDEELMGLRQRGVRADEHGVPGHGLGLSIVTEIVQSLQGELLLGRSRGLGGFAVEVRLPLH